MVAHYARIADALRSRIKTGDLPPGAFVAPETMLASEFGVSRPVVRQAMMMLVNEGYITRTRGRGTIVRERPDQKLSGWVVELIDDMVGAGSIENVLAFGRETRMEVQHFREIPAIAYVASALNIALGDPIYELRSVRSSNDGPAALQLNFMPACLGQLLLGVDFCKVLTLDALEQRASTPISRILQAFTAVSADPSAACCLDVAPGTPLLQIERILISAENNVVLLSITQFRCDRYRPVLTFTPDGR